MNNKFIKYFSMFLLLFITIGISLLLFDKSKINEKISGNLIKQNIEVENEIDIVFDTIESVYNEKNSEFELPINGSTGYASIDLELKESSNVDSDTLLNINKGDAFTILSEDENYWYINYKGNKGYVDHTYCMINLPDIIPSIIYDNTNSYESKFRSSGYELPDITNKKLYDTFMYNNRFQKDEFAMPVLYMMAKKINKAQQSALKNNESLKIYETFRPYYTQKDVVNSLKSLITNNVDVYNGINTGIWNQSWFIASGYSNHQRGVAIDTSLVKINDYKINSMGKYKYIEILDYTEYDMPTNMHELSANAAVLEYGTYSKTITEGAIKLQDYSISVGLKPLPSEWWHFDDLEAKELIKEKNSNGTYYINECVSEPVSE